VSVSISNVRLRAVSARVHQQTVASAEVQTVHIHLLQVLNGGLISSRYSPFGVENQLLECVNKTRAVAEAHALTDGQAIFSTMLRAQLRIRL
jgi:hypothetical protein